MPSDSAVPFNECPAPNLKDLRVEIPGIGSFQFSQINKLLETLALTLKRRADFGSQLERLVVSECLKTRGYWDQYMPPEITNMAELEPCSCDCHSWVFSSDDDDTDDSTGASSGTNSHSDSD